MAFRLSLTIEFLSVTLYSQNPWKEVHINMTDYADELVRKINNILGENNGLKESDINLILKHKHNTYVDEEEIRDVLKDLLYDGVVFWDDLTKNLLWDDKEKELTSVESIEYPKYRHTKTWFSKPVINGPAFSDEELETPEKIPYMAFLKKNMDTLMGTIEFGRIDKENPMSPEDLEKWLKGEL